MKRILGLLVFATLLNGCDDGDLTFESIDFDDVNTLRCSGGNILYKLNDAEALILEVGTTDAAFQAAFPANPTVPGTPTALSIGAANRLVYRLYNGTVTTANICNTIQPPTPTVAEEWTATSGTITIVTTASTIANTATGFEGGEKITGYQHNIVLLNVNFQKPNGTQLYDVFPFGSYTESTAALPFNFVDTELARCPSGLIFKAVGSEALTLYISDSALLDTNVLNTPKTGLIGAAANNVTYMTFPTVVNTGTFCTAPGTPVQTWTGVDGVAGVSGIVEVVTTTFGSSAFKHTIRLKNLSLKKGNSQFLLATDYLYGELITN